MSLRVTWKLDSTTTVGRALLAATQRLREAGIENPRLDAQALLSHVLGVNAAWLYANPYQHLTPMAVKQFETLVARRYEHEPIAYLIGRKEFYGHEFVVDRRVLIPRPETELLVEAALGLVRNPQREAWRRVADVGAGCGAIAVSLAMRCSHIQVEALDISRDALAVARENVRRHKLEDRIQLREGDLLAALDEPVDLIVANLPYVAEPEFVELAPDIVKYEPRVALVSGADGLLHIRRLLSQAPELLQPGGALLLEIGHGQGRPVAACAETLFPTSRITIEADYADLERIVRIETAV